MANEMWAIRSLAKDQKKITLIKELRMLTGKSLKEAKSILDECVDETSGQLIEEKVVNAFDFHTNTGNLDVALDKALKLADEHWHDLGFPSRIACFVVIVNNFENLEKQHEDPNSTNQ